MLEIGFPVEERHTGESEIVTGVLPAGRYASVRYLGHPDGLVDATRDLLAWAEEQGLEWDADGDHWGCPAGDLQSDPREVPDMNDWETELLFRLED